MRHILISDIINVLIDIIMSVMLPWAKREVQVKNKGHVNFDESKESETN